MPRGRRLFLHVGLQKTGTSYLQAALLASRDRLAATGVDLVPPTKRESFELMLAVCERRGHPRRPASDGHALARFAALLATAPGDRAVCSQESLAVASRPQIDRLLDACGDREVHVVLTVRDLARQIPSTWQESVKAGRTQTYEHYVHRLQQQSADPATRSQRPWLNLDAATVLARWASTVPPERIHVVTVPPPGEPATVLLARFARALDVDPGLLAHEDGPSNLSLGHAQTEVLRRVNAGLPREARRRDLYGDVVKRSFARDVLGAQGRDKVLLPLSLRAWCEEVTARQVEQIAAGGYRVEGSLADLRSPDSAFAHEVRPPPEEEVAAAAVSAITAMLAAQARKEVRRRDKSRAPQPTPAGRPALLGRIQRRWNGVAR